MLEARILNLQAGPTVGAKSYDELKAAVLKVGRFSCFEASATAGSAQFYNRLCRDPEVETFDMGYPWTGVRMKQE